jgi:hypothetical protein
VDGIKGEGANGLLQRQRLFGVEDQVQSGGMLRDSGPERFVSGVLGFSSLGWKNTASGPHSLGFARISVQVCNREFLKK